MEQYRDYTFTAPDGNTYTMLEAQYATTKKSASGTKWAVCARCEYTAPAAEMMQRGARYYCHKYDCAEELE